MERDSQGNPSYQRDVMMMMMIYVVEINKLVRKFFSVHYRHAVNEGMDSYR